ncbi:MAG TPA: glycosyltransferase family 4 protein [Longimicrobiaceae bacterium]|nr:glycosyltransferase family 4 protein [Longimicrobiaceae bacterium]
MRDPLPGTMKLLVINWQDRLNPLAGGAEIHLHEIFGRLAARDHRVTLLVSRWSGAAPREQVDGMQVHRVGSRHTFGQRAPGYYHRVLAREGFDLVIEDLNKVPVFAPRWAGRPVVLLVHHLFGRTAFRSASPPVAAATWLLERPLARFYRGLPVQAVSESTAEDLVARGLRREDITVIHNGVDLNFYTADPAVARTSEPSFLYLGRLQRYKRVDLILRAVAQLRQQGVRVWLFIAGKGKAEPALRALARQLHIADRVEFAGFVSEEEKRDLFRRVWANVFTSPKEGWGITNLEAAACGTPTIASDSPGLRESVRHERTGLLVPHGDVAALAAAMHKLAGDPQRVSSLGEGALRFSRRFSWDHAADLTEAHLRGVLASAAGSVA